MNCNHVDKELCICNESNMEWISVKERLPEEHKKVIAYGQPKNDCSCNPSWRVMEASYQGNDQYELGWVYGEYDCQQEVTHWMPLPKTPKD
jgi:hypothetical protein